MISCLKMRCVAAPAMLAACLGLLTLSAPGFAQENGEPETPATVEPTAPSTEEPAAPAADAPLAEAETPPETPANVADAQQGPTDAAELAAFLDGVMTIHLKDKHIAGATLSVVADNKLLFAKGYGFADVAAKKPVSAEETMFRLGSVSKLFTWTAVMQLVEQGKLDLNADVNTYLKDFKIPSTYAEPVTLKHLLTHTPGFEDNVIGLFARSSDKLTPLGELLARDFPTRVRPPGELASYSNHGTALAGYIVAEVSGVPWEDYIEQNILTPLGMQHTTVRQPPTDKLPADMSKGYKFAGGKFKEMEFEYVPAAPAGSMAGSAVDLAKFMIAHLQDGRTESAQILKEDTARQMREQLFTHDEHLDGMAYGFMRSKYNGQVIVQHGGDTFWFHSLFVMIPERKAGFFVSYNTDTAGASRQQLFEAFMDRYYPVSVPAVVEPLADFSERASRYRGSYGMIRHSYTSVAKLGALFGVVRVSADDDLLVLSGAGPVPKRFVEVEPRVFREVDGPSSLVFRADDNGNMTHLFANGSPVALARLPWYETPIFNFALLGACVAIFATAVLGWPFAAFLTRGGRRIDGPRTAGSGLASWLGWLMSLAVLVWLSLIIMPAIEPNELAYGVPSLVESLLSSTSAIVGLAAAVLICTLVAWKQGYWRLSGRLHYTAVLLAAGGFIWFLYHWNLLRFGA